MDRILAYSALVTLGVSATTIAAALIGEPVPVVGPAVVAGLAIAAHHVNDQEADDGDDGLDDDRAGGPVDDDPLGIHERSA